MTASAATVAYCPSGATNVCFNVGIPASTAASGSGNIYFSIAAPISYSWVALGTGSSMVGSNLFVMYQDGRGNVTLSPRIATAHAMPSEDTSSTAAKLTLLEGSGVEGSTMRANVMCSNCESWGSSGKLAVAGSSTSWIAAWSEGSSLAATSANAAISMHDGTAQYKLDLTKATIASDSNPFVTASSGSGSGSGTGSGSDTGSGTGTGSDTGSGDTSTGSDTSGSGSGSDSGVVVSSTPKAAIVTAHAVIMAIVMVILYPIGSAIMPLLGKWLLHGAWQGLAYLLMWAGFALGVVAARQRGLLFTSVGRNHTVIGTVVVAAMGIQPLLGVLHHRHFVQNQSRGMVSHIHIWWGRLLMILGVINGGLGLQLSSASNGLVVGYAVASAVLFVVYVASKVVGAYWLAPRRAQRSLADPRGQPEMAYNLRAVPSAQSGSSPARQRAKNGATTAHYPHSTGDSGSASITDRGYSSGSPVLQQS